jgi:hypothetical protein
MFEKDRVALTKIEFRNRYDLALDLTGAGPEMNFGHVLDARCFAPT